MIFVFGGISLFLVIFFAFVFIWWQQIYDFGSDTLSVGLLIDPFLFSILIVYILIGIALVTVSVTKKTP